MQQQGRDVSPYFTRYLEKKPKYQPVWEPAAAPAAFPKAEKKRDTKPVTSSDASGSLFSSPLLDQMYKDIWSGPIYRTDWGSFRYASSFYDAPAPAAPESSYFVELPQAQPKVEAPSDPNVVTSSTNPVYTAPSHTRRAFDITTMPAIVDWAAELVKELQADAIVACGHSGLAVAGAVAYVTKVPLVAVRKRGDTVVAGGRYANRVSARLPHPARRWVWIDDFLASGGTFRESLEELCTEKVVATRAPIAFLSYGRSPKDYDGTNRYLEKSQTGLDHPIREYGFESY